MSLTQLSDRVYVWEGGVNFAIIKGENRRLILIDSAMDASAPRKALRPFLEEGYQLGSIINTHSHADHIGGNAELVRRFGCQVFAPAKERPMILWPELEPIGLYGGANPPPSLHVKFLMAQPTPEVRELPSAPGFVEVEGVRLELIPVPGHAYDQVAIAIDHVLLAADGLFKPEILAKHPITFLVNVVNYQEGLTRIGERPERYVLPGHGSLIDRQAGEVDPLPEILQVNRDALETIQQVIMQSLAGGPLTLEALLGEVTSRLGKVTESDPQYFLDRAAISAHISHLTHEGRLSVHFEAGVRLLVRT